LNRKFTIILSLFILTIIVCAVSLTLGAVKIPLSQILTFSFNNDESIRKVLFDIRLPRLLNTIIVGASLSCSGIILQSLLRNNLAEPGLLGISAGAGLGAIIMFLLPAAVPFYFITPVSFAFAIISTLVIYFSARFSTDKYSNFISTNKIILTGIAISALLASVNGLLLILAGQSVNQILFWLNGGLAGRGWNEFTMTSFPVLIGLVISFFYSKEFNVLNLGDELAISLGLNLKKIQIVSIVLASLLAACAVSIAGIISFVGLIIPNIAKLIVGNDYRFTIPASVLLGIIFLAVSDVIARVIIAPAELPVGIITSFLGAPVFIWLIMKNKTV